MLTAKNNSLIVKAVTIPSEPLTCSTHFPLPTKIITYFRKYTDSDVFNGVSSDHIPVEERLIKTNDVSEIFAPPIEYDPVFEEIKLKVMNNFTEEFANAYNMKAFVEIKKVPQHNLPGIINPYKVMGAINVQSTVIRFLADYTLNSTKEKFVEHYKINPSIDSFYKGSEDHVTFHVCIDPFDPKNISSVIHLCNKFFNSYVLYSFSERCEFYDDNNCTTFVRIVACKNLRRMMVLDRTNNIERNICNRIKYVKIENALYAYCECIECTYPISIYETKYEICFTNTLDSNKCVYYGDKSADQLATIIKNLDNEQRHGLLTYVNGFEYMLRKYNFVPYYSVHVFVDYQCLSNA